jgi:hypothetical protein
LISFLEVGFGLGGLGLRFMLGLGLGKEKCDRYKGTGKSCHILWDLALTLTLTLTHKCKGKVETKEKALDV